MTNINDFGRLPLGFLDGRPIYPGATFQQWMRQILNRTGGIVVTFSSAEYDTVVAAPISAVTVSIDGSPVSVGSQAIDGSPVSTTQTIIDGSPV